MPAPSPVRIPVDRKVLIAATLVAFIATIPAIASVAAARSQVAVEGTLSAAHGDDFARGRSTVPSYTLTSANGVMSDVAFERSPSQKLIGKRVRLTGQMGGNTLYVADGGTLSSAGTTSASQLSSSTGSHRVAIILINFSNDTSQPYTPAFAQGVAFSNSNSVSAYYSDSSWGQLGLGGDVYGWYTISSTNATCATTTWANAAEAAAAANGFVASNYANVVYAFPNVSACAWAGMGEMPGVHSWLNGPSAMTLRVMAHELGHNFGTHHAGEYKCVENGVQVPLSANTANCTTGEYGDPFSVMGGATHYEQTNFARGNFNWFAASNTRLVTAAGDYTIAPVEQQGSAVSALQVARTSASYFTLEFRQADGSPFDTFTGTSAVANGVLLRLTAPSYASRTQTWLVWAHPAPTFCECNAPLKAGESLRDPVSGLTFSVVSVSSSGATVHIAFGTGGPAPTSPPTPSPTPSPTPTPTPAPTPTPSPTAAPSPTPSPYLSAPGSLKVTVGKSKKATLSWTASTGTTAVAGYRVYRNGVLAATVTGLKWSDGLAWNGTLRTYYVVAYSSTGVLSLPSTQVSIS